MTDTIVRKVNASLVVTDSRVFCAAWRAFDVRLVAALIRRPEVRSVRLDLSTSTCQVRFAAGSDRLEQTATVYSACVREAIDEGQRGIRGDWHSDRPWTTLLAERTDRGAIFLDGFMVHGPRRLLYLALGVGSLVMTFVGLVVPGIPTVPFLLASSYFLARSSQRLHKRLIDSRLLGELLRDWETHRTMSPRSKWKLAGFTLAIILVTVLIAPLSPIVVVLVVVMVSLTLIGVYKIPTIQPAGGPQIAIGT